MSTPVIDCHCHAGIGDGLTGPWDTRAGLNRYLVRARLAGIDKTVLFPVFNADYVRANREVAAIVRRTPERFFGFAFVHAERDRGRIGVMVEEAVRLGLCGIKTHRHDARLNREVCEVALAFRLPILYDPMGDVGPIEVIGQEYADKGLNLIVPHLGSFGDDYDAQSRMVGLVARYPNIYVDTSAVRRFDLLSAAVKQGGARKVLFGTDGPWLHPGVELAKIHALRLPERERALVMGGNLLRLIGR